MHVMLLQSNMSAGCFALLDRGSRAAAVIKLLIRKWEPAGHQLTKGCWHCIVVEQIHKHVGVHHVVCQYAEGCWEKWSNLPAYIDFQSRLRQEDLHNSIRSVIGIKALHDCCKQYTVRWGSSSRLACQQDAVHHLTKAHGLMHSLNWRCLWCRYCCMCCWCCCCNFCCCMCWCCCFVYCCCRCWSCIWSCGTLVVGIVAACVVVDVVAAQDVTCAACGVRAACVVAGLKPTRFRCFYWWSACRATVL